MTQSQREQLIIDHLPLVKVIAIRVHEKLPACVDLDDLTHSGVFGLVDALNKFDESKHVQFRSYAKHRIRGAILDSLRELDWATSDMRRRQKKLQAVKRDLAGVLRRDPTEAETAEGMGVSEQRLRSMMAGLRNVEFISLSSRPREQDDLPAPDFPASPKTYPDAICRNAELASVLSKAVQILPPRYRRVITLYYNTGMSMKEIGGVVGASEFRVSHIHRASIKKLRAHLSERKMTFAALA